MAWSSSSFASSSRIRSGKTTSGFRCSSVLCWDLASSHSWAFVGASFGGGVSSTSFIIPESEVLLMILWVFCITNLSLLV